MVSQSSHFQNNNQEFKQNSLNRGVLNKRKNRVPFGFLVQQEKKELLGTGNKFNEYSAASY